MIWLWMTVSAVADDEGGDDAWDVSAPHGDTHDVDLDLSEVTWASVTVHGEQVVFDLLGDLWRVPLGGGEAERLTSGPAWDAQPRFHPDGDRLAFVSDRGGNENVWTLALDGSDPEPVTTEEVARMTHPVWDASGEWIVARRRTVDTRSIGVTELWQVHADGGEGVALTTLDAHPHAGEPWIDERYVYFSSRAGRFSYNQDPVAGLWRVMRLDRQTGELRTIAHGPGSASRPVLSPDGTTLLFVSRVRTDTVLEALELQTGERRLVADWLSPDALEGFALHGTYPAMDWTDDGRLVLWADGGLWRLDVQTGRRAPIPFHARGRWTLHDVERPPVAVPEEVRARVVRWPGLSVRDAIAFSAMGRLWVRDGGGEVSAVSEGTGYAPAWSPDGTELAWTSWSDTDGGRLHVTAPSGKTVELPVRGQLTNPSWHPDGDRLVVLRGVGGSVSPDLAAEPWYELILLTRDKRRWRAERIASVDARWGARKQRPQLLGDRVYFLSWERPESREPEVATLVSLALDGTDRREHLALGPAIEAALSPDGTRIAVKRNHQLHVALLPPFPRSVGWDDVPHEQVTRVVGDWVGWSPDGTEVTWAEGPEFKRIDVSSLFVDAEESDEDEDAGDEEADPLADREEVVSLPLEVVVPRARPDGTLVITDVRAVTMVGDEILDGVDVVIEGDRIAEVGPGAAGGHPDATVIDGSGHTLIPGLVDVHAHMHFSAGDILPEQEWRYRVALDFGVTTVQDPSTVTDLVFTQAERVEAGFMEGPRVYSTGGVLYGARSSEAADTPDADAARAHVLRLKQLGARSVKVYQQSRRDVRQWYVQACRELEVLCVPEGGGDLFMNLGMIADGYHAIEHSLPTAPLHDDVLSLFAASTAGGGDGFGTFYTPTLQVAYGGLGSKHFFVQHGNPVDDARLRRHFPTRLLERDLWRGSVLAHDTDWRFQQIARDAAALVERGGHVTLGSHGELQGLGAHWELWGLGSDGALSPHEALRAATLEGARYIGLDAHIGTIEVGKLADLVLLGGDPLEDLRDSSTIELVVKNGVIVAR